MVRTAEVKRKTKETEVSVTLNLDGEGVYDIDCPLKFLSHMLESFSKHSLFDLTVRAQGDVEVDDHHLVEDVGILLGEAFDEALGDKRGINRMAHAIIPMDDARAEVSVDLSGRPYAKVDIPFSEFNDKRVGDTSKENIVHLLESFALRGKFNLNIQVTGRNDHHKAEAAFKGLARALREAVRISGRGVPSTKGII